MQYGYSQFLGTTHRYGFWNDMNEPSVFNDPTVQAQAGMPLNNTHFKADGTMVRHRDLHNAYGALQHRATFKGLLARDDNTLRPFVLTRSHFFGSQRYGAMWTGDNNSLFRDVPQSYNQLMSLGLSGIVFGGADIPGFNGTPTDDMYMQFYQVGIFYPFFRAHCNMADPPGNMGVVGATREPWL
jgi:alpha 1,3-glucosidase